MTLTEQEPVEATKTEEVKPPIPMRLLSLEVFNPLIQYLSSNPYNEVRGLIDALTSSQTINVTIINEPAKN